MINVRETRRDIEVWTFQRDTGNIKNKTQNEDTNKQTKNTTESSK